MSPALEDQPVDLGAETDQIDSKAGDSSDEDSESDNEGAKKVSVKDLLDSTLRKIQDGKLDLTDKDDYANFTALDGDHLASNTGDPRVPTALHHMATMDKKDLPRLDSKMQPLVMFLVRRRDSLRVQDRSGHTPLFLAIEAKKEKMVQWMCDAHADISDVLAITSNDKMNCLHIGVDKRVRFLDLLVERASPNTLAAKDSNGNTPLHLAVEYKKCRKEQLAIIERIVSKSDLAVLEGGPGSDFNNAGLSPYLHHKESVRKARPKKKSGNANNNNRRTDPGNADEPGKELRLGHRGHPPSALTVHGIEPVGLPNIRLSTQLDSRGKYGGRPTPAPPVMNSLVVAAMPNLPGLDEKKKSSRGGEGNESSHKSSKVDEMTVKEIERFLKVHYLRSRSYNIAMEILYGRNTTSDQELYFDLSSDISSDAKITQTGLENLLSKLHFEDILQYVAIPKISVQVNAPSQRTSGRRSARQPDGAGRRDLCYIFERLRRKGVETILKVFIDDSGTPAHSDEAIEEALKGMGVEVWDWNRTDLCTEVICRVAPRAREVHLYWSGNNAVLRGWSEEGGLKKLRDLRTVHLHIQQGLESRSRTQKNVKEFNDRMKKLYPEVTIFPEWPSTRCGVGDINAIRAEDQVEHSTKHEWIQCMKDFRRLLFDAERYHEGQSVAESIEEPIKVALIDDGVDIKDLEYTFIGGRTFCTRNEEHNLNDPYYVSSTGHGTIMAKQIHLLCPRAQFYVLRLEDHASEDARQITAKSAAEAIRAAVRKEVHIISMSWTIDPPDNEPERRALDEAIAEAASADILMFCSASDKGAKQTPTYPSKATQKIFTIGAATASGAADTWVGSLTKINFTFPGNKVELDSGPTDTGSVKEVTGSSVATALAAGLAALILYCVQVRVLLASDHEKQKAKRDFQALRKHDGMLRAIKDIGTTEESGHKFIAVWEVFAKQVEKRDQVEQEKWLGLIGDVGTTLCRKI